MRRRFLREPSSVMLLFAFIFVGSLPAFSQQTARASNPLVVLTALASPAGDSVARTLASTMTSSIELMLRLTGRVRVKRADFLDPTSSLTRTIPYYDEHEAAAAVYGSVSPAAGGGYTIELEVWNAAKPKVEPIAMKRTISNVLSSFNLADVMSLRVASTIVGKRLEEGTLIVRNVSGLPEFSVYANGHLLGRNRTSFPVLTGSWKIVVAKPGEVGDVPVQSFHVDIEKGKTAKVTLSPPHRARHATGSISVSTSTAGTLYLDGRKMGHIAPGSSTFTSVRVGVRKLTVHYADGRVARKAVTVRAGSTATAAFTESRSGPRSRWTEETLPKSEAWQSVTYGGGIFVAVAPYSRVTATSRDGVDWTAGSLPGAEAWQSVTYGGGTFVAVASGSRAVATSRNGINWRKHTLPTIQSWTSVTYGNGVFVAVAAYGDVVATSRNGANWRRHTMSSGADWQSVAYGNGTFVAVAANNSVVATSRDGVNWTESPLPSSQEWQSATYGGGTFLAVAAGSSVAATSSNGTDWTPRYLPGSRNWTSVAYGNGSFVAVAAGSTVVANSRNGFDWIERSMPSSKAWQSVAYGNGTFVAVAAYSSSAATSP